ncbi:putative odorant receptor 85e [Sitodiplosis mosellana]|uniref:putative odorant receptor 85e n=1 Tax=Sitodiplosis mosellana TaxID=263140 RepID=UPI0024442373|nr:putative odorant receptor 85e [Sitodiplosis mosellana]
MRYRTILLKLAGMCYINFERYLPKQLEFISVYLNWSLFGFFSFVHLHLAILFLLEMIRSSALEVITNAITMVIINVFAFFTLLYYKLNYKKYLRMVEYMNTQFLTRSAYGLTFMTAEKSYIVANRYTFWWTVMCMQGTLQWAIVPLFASTRTLPIELKYPMDELADPYYQIIYFLHSMCQYLLGVIFGNASSVLASTVIIASGQFDMLLCSLKNLQATAMTLNGSRLEQLRKLQSMVDSESEELNQYYLAAELMDDIEANTAKMRAALDRDPSKFQLSKKYLPQDNYLTDLTEELNFSIFACIRHHQMLIEFSAMMEDFFSVFVLLKSFQSTFQICNLLFTFLKIEGTAEQYFNMTAYLILTLLDVFQLCYFGETLKQQSSHIGDALLRCPWHLSGGPFRRIALIFLANCTKPLVMTGGKFFILDFQKLTSIMKASFSYFTLLQHLGK